MSNNKEIVKIYVDNCILSKLVWYTIEKEHLEALEKICENDCIDFVTSPIILEEFNKTPQAHIRVALKVFYKLINKIPNVNFIKFKGGFSVPFSFPVNFGIVEKDELYRKLENIFKKTDIKHIYNAVKDNCDYFLTLDYETILDIIKKDSVSIVLKEICPDMQFVDPKTLLEKI